METVELRPLTLGELLDRTFALYRRHFWLFVGIMAIPSALSIPMNAFFLAGGGMQSATQPPSAGLAGGIGAAFFAFLILFWFVYAVAIGAATYAVSESYLGQTATVRGSYQKVKGRFWRIIGLVVNIWFRVVGIFALVMIVAIGIAAVAGIVAGAAGGQTPGVIGMVVGIAVVLAYLAGTVFCFIWLLRYTVSIPALLLENLGIRAAIRRSVQLTKGRKRHLFMAILLAAIMGYIGVIIFQGPFLIAMFMSAQPQQLPGWLLLAFSLSGAIGGAITGSLLMIVLVLCYYDTRIRKEAFDLQFMMSTLDQPAAPASGAVQAS
jgi:hypothetical protein